MPQLPAIGEEVVQALPPIGSEVITLGGGEIPYQGTSLASNILGVNKSTEAHPLAEGEEQKPPSLLERLNQALFPMARPDSVSDVGNLLLAGTTGMKAPGVNNAAADAVAATGRGLQRAGEVTKRPLNYVAAGEMVMGRSPVKAAVTLAAPYAMEGAGKGLINIAERLRSLPFHKQVEILAGDAAEITTKPTIAPILEAPTATKPLGPVRYLTIKSDKLTPDMWQDLRRYVGAEKLAKLTGKTVDEVRAIAPGPSRYPIEVENQYNDQSTQVTGWKPSPDEIQAAIQRLRGQ